jgi:hypothetical protein
MIAVVVDVHGLARNHHRRGSAPCERQQPSSIVGREAEAIDKQVRPGATSSGEVGHIPAVGADERDPEIGKLRRHVRRVAAGHVDTPADPGKALRDRATDDAGATKDQSSHHATTLAGGGTPSRPGALRVAPVGGPGRGDAGNACFTCAIECAVEVHHVLPCLE